MQSKHLDVSHVLMVVDPSAGHWRRALILAEALTECGVKTTLACISAPSPAAKSMATHIPDIDLKYGHESESLEWMLFLEMLVQPDIVQIFEPEHAVMPWRSPTVVHVPERVLVEPNRALMETASSANLIVVEDEDRFEKLQSIVGDGPFIAVLKCAEDCGWNYFLAYQEIVQSVNSDFGEETAGRFELI